MVRCWSECHSMNPGCSPAFTRMSHWWRQGHPGKIALVQQKNPTLLVGTSEPLYTTEHRECTTPKGNIGRYECPCKSCFFVHLDPSAVADSQISRRIFVSRKSASLPPKIPASRNRRQKCSAEYKPEKIRPVHVGC